MPRFAFLRVLGIILSTVPLGLAFPVGGTAHAQSACGARDWRCLLAAAAGQVQSSKDKESGDSRGRYFVDIAEAYPEAEQIGVASSFLAAAGDEEELKARLENFLVPAKLRLSPDLNGLQSAIAGGVSPDADFALPEYVKMSFDGLIARNDRDQILNLWRANGKFIWRDAPQAELAIEAWLAQAEPALLADSIKARGLPDGGWASLSAVAERLCRTGEIEHGRRVLALLDQQREQWNTNRSNDTTNLASSVAAVAACRGLDAAAERLRAAADQMRSDIAGIRTHVADQDDAEASVALLQEAFGETGLRPLVRAYLDASKENEASSIFSSLSPQGAGGWKAERAGWEQARSYSTDAKIVLADLDRWEKQPRAAAAVDAAGRMRRSAEALMRMDGDRRGYVRRLLAIGERLGRIPGLRARVTLARTEFQLAGCRPTEERLLAWQKAFSGAPDLGTRVEGRIALAGLLRTMESNVSPPSDPTYGACLAAGQD